MTLKTRTAALFALAIATALPAFAQDAKPAGGDKPAAEQPAQPRRQNPNRAANPNRPAGNAAANRIAPADLYEKVSPSLVAIKYTWDFELRRQELIGPGIVVGEDGLIVTPLMTFSPVIPDAQMKDFKIVVPSADGEPEEIEAEFVGRDERVDLAFVRPVKKQAKSDKDKPAKPHTWTPIKFEDAPLKIGEPLWSIGILPEAAGYRTYLQEARVSAKLRGESPQIVVTGGLGNIGAPVFNARGQAIGLVQVQQGFTPFMNDGPRALAAITNPPRFFIPSSDFLLGLNDPPVAGKAPELPWLGVVQMTGVSKDVAEAYGLNGEPAVQIGDVIPDGPGAKAGLKQGDIIVKVDGKPLVRGDEAEELPIILRRQMVRRKVGDEVTLSILRKLGDPATEVKLKLTAQPMQPNQAKRLFFEDLGFGVRELVFGDRYGRRMAADAGGVLVSVTKPQGAAQTGGLLGDGSGRSDVIVSLNGQPVKDIAGFEKAYRDLRKEKPREAVVLVVRREGREDTVRIEPPQ
jgi:serine protease Do